MKYNRNFPTVLLSRIHSKIFIFLHIHPILFQNFSVCINILLNSTTSYNVVKRKFIFFWIRIRLFR